MFVLLLLPACPALPALQKAKMKDMGEQLEDMSSELGKLRVENNSLKNRNTILEKVLALRDEHIRMLQDEQQVRVRCGAQTDWLATHAAESTAKWLHLLVPSVWVEMLSVPQFAPPAVGLRQQRFASSASTQLSGSITVCLRCCAARAACPPPPCRCLTSAITTCSPLAPRRC